MSALFTLSYWIALVTVVPGLVTLAAVYGAVAFVDDGTWASVSSGLEATNEWILVAGAVAVMVLTQGSGILLEEVLVGLRLLGRGPIPPHGIDRYDEYGRLYVLLARMTADDDAHGHLRRAVAQFFLTLNTLVSFGAGIAAAWIVVASSSPAASHPAADAWASAWLYTLAMLACLGVSYAVAVIRMREMARSIRAVRDDADVAATSDDAEGT